MSRAKQAWGVFCHTQGSINITEGGRYKLISDGDNNNMISLAISKVKASDEGEYKLTIENCHGSDEANFMLYVSGIWEISNPLMVVL